MIYLKKIKNLLELVRKQTALGAGMSSPQGNHMNSLQVTQSTAEINSNSALRLKFATESFLKPV